MKYCLEHLQTGVLHFVIRLTYFQIITSEKNDVKATLASKNHVERVRFEMSRVFGTLLLVP